MALVPTNEVIESALRKMVPMYPEIAIRELVANAIFAYDSSAAPKMMKYIPWWASTAQHVDKS